MAFRGENKSLGFETRDKAALGAMGRSRVFTPVRLSENIHETPEGFLLCKNVPIMRTGEQEYAAGEIPLEADENGRIIVTKSIEDIFDPDTMASFNTKALTIKHPEQMITPDNWADIAKGVVTNVRPSVDADENGEYSLLADIVVKDALAILMIKNGLREVSCGYYAEYVQDGPGRGRQKTIVGNHLALVEKGRAGESYAINDHKGKVTMATILQTFKDKLRGLNATVDAGLAEEAAKGKSKDEDAPKPKEEKAKDAAPAEKEAILAALKELMAKVEGMGSEKEGAPEAKAADEDKDKSDSKDEDEDKAKDEDDDSKEESDAPVSRQEFNALSDDIKALQVAMKQVLGDDDSEESEAKDEDKDADKEKSKKGEAKDAAIPAADRARIEILAPGFKPEAGKDYRKSALKRAYATTDGKAVIDELTSGKGLAEKKPEQVQLLFTSASSVLKAKRGNGLRGTKDAAAGAGVVENKGPVIMTSDLLNEKMAAFWGQKVKV